LTFCYFLFLSFLLIYFRYKHDYNLAYLLANKLEDLDTNIKDGNLYIYINNQDYIIEDELITYLSEKWVDKKVQKSL